METGHPSQRDGDRRDCLRDHRRDPAAPAFLGPSGLPGVYHRAAADGHPDRGIDGCSIGGAGGRSPRSGASRTVPGRADAAGGGSIGHAPYGHARPGPCDPADQYRHWYSGESARGTSVPNDPGGRDRPPGGAAVGTGGMAGMTSALAADPAIVELSGTVVDGAAAPLAGIPLVITEELSADGGIAAFQVVTAGDGSFTTDLYAWGTAKTPATVTVVAAPEVEIVAGNCSQTWGIAIDPPVVHRSPARLPSARPSTPRRPCSARSAARPARRREATRAAAGPRADPTADRSAARCRLGRWRPGPARTGALARVRRGAADRRGVPPATAGSAPPGLSSGTLAARGWTRIARITDTSALAEDRLGAEFSRHEHLATSMALGLLNDRTPASDFQESALAAEDLA